MNQLTLDNKAHEISSKAKPESESLPNYMDIDLFANSRLDNPEEFFEYPTICPRGANAPVPDYYIKYVEPVNSEV